MIHLVTGRAGKPHVSAADDGTGYAGIIGLGNYVMGTGDKIACSIINNNLIRISSGDLFIQGRHVKIEGYEEAVIENGQQAVKRHDLIVARYEKNGDSGIEAARIVVVKGEGGSTPADPEYENGSIFDDDLIADMPLYRVVLEGTNITAIDAMFDVVMPMSEYQGQITKLQKDLQEQKEEIIELNSNIDKLIKVEKYTNSVTVNGNTSATMTKDVSQQGYTPIGIITHKIGTTWVGIKSGYIEGNTVTMIYRNEGTTNVTNTLHEYTVLYIKNI